MEREHTYESSRASKSEHGRRGGARRLHLGMNTEKGTSNAWAKRNVGKEWRETESEGCIGNRDKERA
eukprot:2651378-Pleurochrysis_carterae.AAC.1